MVCRGVTSHNDLHDLVDLHDLGDLRDRGDAVTAARLRSGIDGPMP
jgi:hypothetical protein